MAPEKICKNCVYWLEGTSIKDYGYCVKRDAYKPEVLTCDHFSARAEYLVRKERVDAIADAIMEDKK